MHNQGYGKSKHVNGQLEEKEGGILDSIEDISRDVTL